VRRMFGVVVLAAAAGIFFPAAAVAATALPTSQVPQRFGVRLVDVPVSEAGNPRALRYIIDFLHPGTVIRRRILIVNQESRPSTFLVYPDAAMIEKGAFIGDAGATRSELTTWITVQHAHVTLAPGASAFDLVTIKVPRIATKGEHYGVIWVQQSSHEHSRRGFGVIEVNRVGIRIYLAIGRGGVPPTRWTVGSIIGHRTQKGRQYLSADVDNTGGRAIDVTGTLRLSGGPGGVSAGPFQMSQTFTLAPGQSIDVTFPVPRALPVGPWLASIKTVSGLNVVKAASTIKFDNHLVRTTFLGLGSSIWVSGVIALLLLCVMGFWITRRASAPRGVRPMPAHALRAR